jgi:hypothetical protein
MEYDEQEVMQAVSHGFRTLCEVHEAYVLEPHVVPPEARREEGKHEDMVIVAKGNIARCYAPLMHPELPNALAKIRYGDEAAALAFVHKYGLLGYGKLVPFTQHPSRGDPLPWFWTHAETVHIYLEVASHLQNEDMDSLAKYLHSFRSPASSYGEQEYWPSAFIASRERVYLMTANKPPTSDVLYDALQMGIEMRLDNAPSLMDYGRWFLRTLVNPNIAGIHPEIAEFEGHDRPCFVFHALCEMVYWHLANPLGKLSLRRCANPQCQAPFFPKTAKQKYCPPLWGQSESPCANRHRVNKWRRAHAEQGA